MNSALYNLVCLGFAYHNPQIFGLVIRTTEALYPREGLGMNDPKAYGAMNALSTRVSTRFATRVVLPVLLLAVFLVVPAPVLAQGGSRPDIQRVEFLIAQGNYVEALAALRSASAQAPGDYRVRYYSGMALLGLQRFSEARTEAEMALTLAPDEAKASVKRLLSAIDLQSASLTAEADAEVAVAAGLDGRAARLFAQAFEADPSKSNAGFRAANIFLTGLAKPVDAVKILRKIEAHATNLSDRVKATNELKKLAPVYSPIVYELVGQARSFIDAGNEIAAKQPLLDAQALEPTNREVLIQRLRLAALGDKGELLEAAFMGLSKSRISFESVLPVLPRPEHWSKQAWFVQLLEDYQGAEYARKVVLYLGRPRETKDCDECPAMVALPPGRFVMGSPASEIGRDNDEGPQRTIRIDYEIAVSKYEVTRSDYEACVLASGCRTVVHSNLPPNSGSPNRMPVEVSIDDAKQYAAWLSHKTGRKYRLLSEAEWEYAARAGSNARWSFGDDQNLLVNFGWLKSNSDSIQAVGGKRANSFGLHDMIGNVLEWVQDCYHPDYSVQPSDGSSYRPQSCDSHISRGGASWVDPLLSRSANRFKSALGPYTSRGLRIGRLPD
jgi:formylglycine-generating enzyme required for sulfatase activity